jgi:hypothetical protein
MVDINIETLWGPIIVSRNRVLYDKMRYINRSRTSAHSFLVIIFWFSRHAPNYPEKNIDRGKLNYRKKFICVPPDSLKVLPTD